MFFRTLLPLVASALLIAATLPAADAGESSSKATAVPQTTGFVLSVDRKAPGSKSLVDGDYDAAIKRATASVKLNQQRSAYLNLCAAYIGKRALQEARKVCDDAVQAAESPITTARSPYGGRDRDGLAKAYSNRAILNMLLGKVDAGESGHRIGVTSKQAGSGRRQQSRCDGGGGGLRWTALEEEPISQFCSSQ